MARRQIWAAVAVAMFWGAGGADAALVIEIQPANMTAAPTPPPNFGQFDVLVRGVGATPAVIGFDVTLSLREGAALATGATFRDVDRPSNYIFASNPAGPTRLSLPDQPTINFVGAGLSSVTILDGQTFGLATVIYDIGLFDPAMIGDLFDIRLDAATFTEPTLATFPASNVGADLGDIAIVTPAAVPEPSSMTLLAVCGLLGGGVAWRRRRAAVKAAPAANPVEAA